MHECRLWTFKQDVTPAVGDYLCGGLHGRSIGLESRLWLRGIILKANDTYYILAAIDYCYLAGDSQLRLETSLAQGANIPAEQVALHSTHVHSAPMIDERRHSILAEYGWQVHNEEYFAQVVNDACNSVKRALEGEGNAVDAVSFAQAPVLQFASNRRVLDENGRCRTRWSICADDKIREAPEGKIDPMLRQVVFLSTDRRPIASLSFYASHPQVSNMRQLISGDTVGLANQLFEEAYPEAFPLYFTGAAGDITAGKYTTRNSARNRLVFGVRLFDGMDDAFKRINPQTLENVGWMTQKFDVPLSPIQESAAYYEEMIRSRTASETGGVTAKLEGTFKLDRLRRRINQYRSRISRLSLNDINILFMPSEMHLEYQRYAGEALGPMSAVAAYADSFLRYVPTDDCFQQGGYEVEPRATELSLGAESIFKREIDWIAQWEINGKTLLG